MGELQRSSMSVSLKVKHILQKLFRVYFFLRGFMSINLSLRLVIHIGYLCFMLHFSSTWIVPVEHNKKQKSIEILGMNVVCDKIGTDAFSTQCLGTYFTI
jgi:hypothetical protein